MAYVLMNISLSCSQRRWTVYIARGRSLQLLGSSRQRTSFRVTPEPIGETVSSVWRVNTALWGIRNYRSDYSAGCITDRELLLLNCIELD